ncbi:DUF3256 family protein [Bacteroides sp. 214]|uniref:DUF3256 family protein n=1 Tax=Bacteroides sp. 214 TaxID=2302935 RepID=UPI0013D50B89|nr:DUF3256 family protein [Bacteroides sp. 214]NDW12345.1 DUF3256 family protein [Bacteroides sp. 214]
MKQFLLLLTLLFSCTFLKAQEVRTYFLAMPDSLTPLLSPVNKADFIDYLDGNMKAQVRNKFDSISEMLVLTPTYIKIQMTEKSTWQLKVLALNDSTNVLCTVSTACAPVCDSSIRFYSAMWEELPSENYMETPLLADFLQQPADSAALTDYYYALRKADVFLTRTELSAESDEMTIVLTTPEYIEGDSKEKLKSYMRDLFLFRWTNGLFVKQD